MPKKPGDYYVACPRGCGHQVLNSRKNKPHIATMIMPGSGKVMEYRCE
jgi:hypothetical protein